MNFFKHPKFWIPFLLIFLLELSFKIGIWEPFAKKDSHAGRSIRLKTDLKTYGTEKIDFITLGNSRAVYGINHQEIARKAGRLGLHHVNVTIPGAHFLSLRYLTEWFGKHSPRLQGAVVAISVGDMAAMGNGSYELAIIEPFREGLDYPSILKHVSWNSEAIDTYGIFSSLFQYRADVHHLFSNPSSRIQQMVDQRPEFSKNLIEMTSNVQTDLCAILGNESDFIAEDQDFFLQTENPQLDDVALCLDVPGLITPQNTQDYKQFLQEEIPPEMRRLKETWQNFFRNTPWSPPTLVVFLPEHHYLMKKIHPKHVREWALSILKPLEEEGTIRLLDLTNLHDKYGKTDCKAFFDIFHMNSRGREKVMRHLMPEIEKLYLANQSLKAHANVSDD